MTSVIERERAQFASMEDVEQRARETWRPPPRLSLSQWADEHFYLSAESAATPGRWHTLPYQREIMDVITDPRVTYVSVMKSARVGYTKIIDAAIGYHIHHDPCSILAVQPTLDDAKGYSKEEIAPMLRDCPALSRVVFEDTEEKIGPKDSGNTILHKRYPGGVLSMVGANSGAGFRRISRRVVVFDEVDAYPLSAGSDGDPVKLGTKRAEYFHNRKIIAGSTPLLEGVSRIAKLFAEGDGRRYYVPCPECGHMDFLVFREQPSGGHWLHFDPKAPDGAHFVCSKNGCVIEHHHKRTMIERGEWRAARPFNGHASFHIWAAYSYSPNATWADLAKRFLAAKDDPEELKTFVNTELGECWQERGEAPDWQRLHLRSGEYDAGTVPDGVDFLTAGVDVQRDRWVYEVVGWNIKTMQSWSIQADVIRGNPSRAEDWAMVDALLNTQYPLVRGGLMGITTLAVDSGDQTQQVYAWGRAHDRTRVLAVKGKGEKDQRGGVMISLPSKVDLRLNGQRVSNGYQVWPVVVSIAKTELYGWLRMARPEDGQPYPQGWCHFPEYPQEYFKQLTAEQLVKVRDERTGRDSYEWHKLPGRENHWLDCRVYARAAASVLGLDRVRRPVSPPVDPPAQIPRPPAQQHQTPRRAPDSGFLSSRGKGWLRRR